MIYIELCLYILIAGIILSRKPVYSLLLKVHKAFLVSFLCLLVALVGSQLWERHLYTYPFVHWGMYSSTQPAADYRTYQIELKDGTTRHYPFEEVSLTAARPLMSKIENLEWLSEYRNEDYVQSTVKDLIAVYEKNHAGARIERFTITEIKLSRNPTAGGFTEEKSTIFDYKRP